MHDDDVNTVPQFARLPQWCRMSGMSRSASYVELGRGNLRAVKCGNATLIDVPHGLAWLRSLPPAQIRAPKAA
jgi:hypothetical protein